MGGRLSMPKAADGLSEAPKSTAGDAAARLTRNKGIINGRVSEQEVISFIEHF
jgi:hypothetical protein